MTQLYLNDTRVFMSDTKIKLTRENAYFSQSGSYTLDVQLPLNIDSNKLFFGNIERIEASKKNVKYKTRLVVDNIEVLNGSATITSISNQDVKVQLLGGYSDINFLAKFGEEYIDKIPFGEIEIPDGFKFFREASGAPQCENTKSNIVWIRGKTSTDKTFIGTDNYVCMPIFDETNDKVNNQTIIKYQNDGKMTLESLCTCIQPNLLYVIRTVLQHYGYCADFNELNREPFNKIYIANVASTFWIENILPHWTVKEFLEQIQYFFNATFIFDEVHKKVNLKSNLSYFTGDENTFSINEEYSSEISSDEDESTKSLSSSNVRYSCSDSQEHFYDCLKDELYFAYEHLNYKSKDEMITAISLLQDEDKRKYIFICPSGEFVWGTDDEPDVTSTSGSYESGTFGGHDESSTYVSTKKWKLKQVNQFGPIYRKDNDSGIDIKICPVAISTEHTADYYTVKNITGTGGPFYEKRFDYHVQMPSMANELSEFLKTKYSGCAWAGIYGSEEAKKTEKSIDRIEVFFVDSKVQYMNKPGVTDTDKKIGYPMSFTDCLDKAINLIDCEYQNVHSPWSMALTNNSAEVYIGKLHNNSYHINTNVEQQIEFFADAIPDVSKIFIIKNKRYACKKIEVSIDNIGIDKKMKGYFYEMI